MATNQSLASIEIDARLRQIAVTVREKGRGRHQRYRSLNEAPAHLRADALALIRSALQNSGYESMAQIEELLEAPLVTPGSDATKAAE